MLAAECTILPLFSQHTTHPHFITNPQVDTLKVHAVSPADILQGHCSEGCSFFYCQILCTARIQNLFSYMKAFFVQVRHSEVQKGQGDASQDCVIKINYQQKSSGSLINFQNNTTGKIAADIIWPHCMTFFVGFRCVLSSQVWVRRFASVRWLFACLVITHNS